jgi:hypothetical protein
LSGEFIHPVTGEVLTTKEEFLAALMEEEERLSPIYRTVWALRDGMTERFEAPEMPDRVNRTATQEKVSRCPRCGGLLNEPSADQ